MWRKADSIRFSPHYLYFPSLCHYLAAPISIDDDYLDVDNLDWSRSAEAVPADWVRRIGVCAGPNKFGAGSAINCAEGEKSRQSLTEAIS